MVIILYNNLNFTAIWIINKYFSIWFQHMISTYDFINHWLNSNTIATKCLSLVFLKKPKYK